MNLTSAKDLTDIISGLATTIALLVGGWWSYEKFFRKRELYPHSALAHELTDRLLPDGTRWLHVSLVVRNKGRGLLTVASASARVHQVFPPPPGLLDSLGAEDDVISAGEIDYAWPLLRERRWERVGEPIEIEPGESDRFEYDFFLDGVVRTIEVYSFVRNVRRFDREMGWSMTTIYDMTAID